VETVWIVNVLAITRLAEYFAGMPACTQNVKKRKTRRIKNDRVIAAKRALKAKG
jgi:hypothetical protein